MLYYEKLNWDSEKISNCLKKEKELVLSVVSNKSSIYIPTQNIFAISNELINDIFHFINDKNKIIISNLKSLNKKIPLIDIIKKWNLWYNIIDINGLYYSKYGQFLTNRKLIEYNDKLKYYNNIHKNYIKTRYSVDNLNIPEPILYDLEYQNSICWYNIYNDCKEYLQSSEYYAYILRTIIFSELENYGIYYNNKLIYPIYYIDNSYSGRVSCSWKKINFMALNKNSEINNQITSIFENDGNLYNFDYDSFHPRIIFNLMNDLIPYNENGHLYLSEKYFKNDNDSKDEIKKKIFRILYGSKIKNNQLSDIINNFKEKIIFMKTNLNRWITDDIEDRKKLNYFIQKYEVDLMTESMLKILKLLKKYKSKLILYQYDSLIFDIHNSEKDILLNKIKDIMENINNMKFKVNIKYGKTLKDIR